MLRSVSPPAPSNTALFRRAADVTTDAGKRVPTGFDAWDHVLGGGAWMPSTVLLAGPPGVGKSSRALTLGCALATRTDRPCLYVSAEMPASTLRAIAERLSLPLGPLLIGEARELDATLTGARSYTPPLACVVFDSLPMFRVADETGHRAQLAALKRIGETTRAIECLALVIQHVTKEGEIAGAEALQHEVDVVAYIEPERLRTIKNRHGPAPRHATLTCLP